MKPIHFRYYARYCTDEPLLLLSACFVWNTKTYKGWYAKYNLLIKVHFNTLQIFLVFDGIIDNVVPYQTQVKQFSSSSYDFKNRSNLRNKRQDVSKNIYSCLTFDITICHWTSLFYKVLDGFQRNIFCLKNYKSLPTFFLHSSMDLMKLSKLLPP